MEVTLEITRECPLNCMMCSSNGGLCHPQEMPTLAWLQVIRNAARLGATKVCFSGGEPILRPGFHEMLSCAKQEGLSVVVYSSGNTYDNKHAGIAPFSDSLSVTLAEYANQVVFGIHGPNQKTHDFVTGTCGSFANLVKSAKKMRNLDVPISGHFVPLKMNYRQIADTVSLCQEIGMTNLGILRLVPQGRALLNREFLEVNTSEIKEFTGILMLMDEERKRFIKLGAPLAILGLECKSQCSLGERMTIQSHGVVAPCEAFKGFVNKVEHLDLQNHTLSGIWRSSWFQKLVSLGVASQKGISSVGASAFLCPAQLLMNDGYDPYDVFAHESRIREHEVLLS